MCYHIGSISVVILIRTDTTLDLSQKAEKVCLCLVRGLIEGLEAGRDGAFVAGGDRQLRERELPQPEILLWTTPKEPPRALQASECRELLDPTRASCLILAQRQPGKFNYGAGTRCIEVLEAGRDGAFIDVVNETKTEKLAAPKGLPRRSPTPVLTGPCNG